MDRRRGRFCWNGRRGIPNEVKNMDLLPSHHCRILQSLARPHILFMRLMNWCRFTHRVDGQVTKDWGAFALWGM